MPETIRIRQAAKRDVSAIEREIVEWLNWRTPREESIKRAIENKEILVAYQDSKVIGFIHFVLHEDIIDGGLNSFITCFYVAPQFRNKGIGSELLDKAINEALTEGAVGIAASTAGPDARRLYEAHHFKQFMGKGTMGEVFLEMDMDKYGRSQKPSRVKRI
ncbi:MAG TPA: GNAT family N-acetyltransferase [candidate division Zixibacteria bacterium]|nr:GNAT family N-acetyltransferase [candidate division Zixibacteria bacterium]